MFKWFKKRRKDPYKDEKTPQEYLTVLIETHKKVEDLQRKKKMLQDLKKIHWDDMQMLRTFKIRRRISRIRRELKIAKREKKLTKKTIANLNNEEVKDMLQEYFSLCERPLSESDNQNNNRQLQAKYELDKAHVETLDPREPGDISTYPVLHMNASTQRLSSGISSPPAYQSLQVLPAQPSRIWAVHPSLQQGLDVLAERGFDHQQIDTAYLNQTIRTPYPVVRVPERHVVSDSRVRAGNRLTALVDYPDQMLVPPSQKAMVCRNIRKQRMANGEKLKYFSLCERAVSERENQHDNRMREIPPSYFCLDDNNVLKKSSGVDKVSLILFNVPAGRENEHKRRVMLAECGNIQNCKKIADTSVFTAGRQRMTFSTVAVRDTYGMKIFVITWEGKLFVLSESGYNNWSWRKIKGTSMYGHGPEPSIVVLDGKIYACGGGWERATWILPNGRKTGRFSSKCEFFDVEEEVWIKATSMPYEIRRNSVIAANGNGNGNGNDTCQGCIFSVGGCTRSRPKRYSNELEMPDKGIAVKYVTRYDPSTQEWKQMSSLCEARVGPGLATSGHKLYALGGARENRNSYSDSIEMYDIPTNTWTIIAQRMQIGRMLSAQVVVGDEVTVFGGEKDRRGTIERICLKNTNDAPFDVIKIPGAEETMSMATAFFTE